MWGRDGIPLVRVKNGTLRPKEKILFMATGAQHLTEHIGVFTPKAQDRDTLSAGQVGFVIAGIKELKAAKVGDTISMNYVGMLSDGTVFDSSANARRAFKFQLGVGEVIQGWDLGIVGMKVGSKRRLIIPPELGYGASGAGPIPPNATLIFEVELIEIVKK